MTNAWFILILAGLMEVGWALGLKSNPDFSRPVLSVLTVAAIIGSMWLLAQAMRELPLGTAYATWVGIGAVGAVIAGAVFHGESLSALKVVSVLAIVGGLVGLKMAS